MPGLTRKIHQGRGRTAFTLLVLSHGFDKENDFFNNYCNEVVSIMLKRVDPFKFAKRNLSIWAHYIPEELSLPIETINGYSYLRDPKSLITYMKNFITQEQPKDFPVHIWDNVLLTHQRGICIVTKSNFKPSVIPHTYYDYFDSEESANSHNEVFEFQYDQDLKVWNICITPYVVMTSWPTERDSQPKFINKYVAAAGQMAQSIGMIMGLAPEIDSGFVESYDFQDQPTAPNLVSGIQQDDISAVWKWIRYRPVVPVDISFVEHPDQNAARSVVLAIRNQTRENVIVLRHWEGNKPVRYVKSPLHLLLDKNIGVNMIEGGMGYKKNIYRPAVECIMRYSGWDKTYRGGKKKRILTEFCPICRKEILGRLKSIGEFGFKGPRVVANINDIPNGSNTGLCLLNYVKKYTNDYHKETNICVEATMRRISEFFKKSAPNYLYRVEPIHNWGNWQKKIFYENRRTGFGVPSIFEDPNNIIRIWLSNTKFLRKHAKFAPFVGLGAPGALAYAGFGRIVNVLDENRSDVLGVPVYKSLDKEKDLKNLAPGSVLQFWRPSAYDWIVRYAGGWRIRDNAEQIEKNPNGRDPGRYMKSNNLDGHSLIFIGVNEKNDKEESKNYDVADQNAPVNNPTTFFYWANKKNIVFKSDDLIENREEGFTFWIAMEWYEIEGLKDIE